MIFLTLVLFLVVLAALVVLVFRRPVGIISSTRLERFARRQCLWLTPDNVPRITDYLATTRRWRVGGMVLFFVVAAAAHVLLGHRAPDTSVLLFAGWFVGAVLAEWRISTGQRDGVRRAASLAPRRLTDYVSRRTVLALGACLVLVLVAQVWLWVRLPVAHAVLAAVIAGTVACPLVIATVASHTLRRPQALGPQDVLLADDALRSRSLHVLLGSGLAVVGLLATTAQSVAANRVFATFNALPHRTPANLDSSNQYDYYPRSAHSVVAQFDWINGGYAESGLFLAGLILLGAGVLLATATFRAVRPAALAPVTA